MKRVFLVFLTSILFTSATSLYSQGLGGGGSSRIEGRAKFLPVPYLNYDRSAGFTLGAVPMLMFNPVMNDTLSPSSIVGGVGTYSTNETWFMMGFGMFFLDEDNWRITTAGGVGSINFQFFLDGIIGIWIPYQTDAKFFFLKGERRIYKHLYGGISYIFADAVSTSTDFPISDSLRSNGYGLNLSLDTRDNPHYPRKGYLSSVKYTSFPGFFGNESVSHKLDFEYNHYFSSRRNKDVIAARLFAGVGLGDLAFSQQYIVGRKDIRGYTQGAFRGNNLLALQGEYRWNFHKRWGAVGFAGVATVLQAINESDNGKPLPCIGTGIRFKAFPETNFSVGLDVAMARDDWGIYFQIGEAF